ncbi:MAG: HlyD family efflux transporter periplasmic adaptor subunit [Candidatus Eiseniibacteriota bacterium]
MMRHALVALVCALVLVARSVGAHEGHGTSGTPDARAPEITSPGGGMRVAESETHELVLKHETLEPGHSAHLHFYLSDWASNRPIEGATLEAHPGPDSTLTAKAVGPGVFELDCVFRERGYAKLDVVVRRGASVDLLSFDSLAVGVEEEHGDHDHDAVTASARGDGDSHGGRAGGLPGWLLPVAVGVLVAIALGFLVVSRSTRRSRGRGTALVVPFAALAVLGFASETARAQSPSGAARYMAKEAQFLLGLVTEPARTENVPESRTAFGTVVADPASVADIVAPQAGKLVGSRAWRVGDRIARGQEFGELLVVDALPVRAPIGGSIASVHAVPGQTVAAGQVLARVVRLDRVRVEIPLYGDALEFGLRAVRADLRVSALPDRVFAARIEGLAPEASAGGGPAVPLILSVSSTGGFLRPGMVVEAALHGRIASRRVTVPASAMVRTEQGPVVFVKTGAETFELRPVTPGARSGSRVAIEKGVEEGERVVVTEAFPLLSAAAPR